MLRPGQTRFLLALSVIFYHINQNIFLGEFAVGCFFILSGYWIALMYESKYSKKANSLKIFYISRFWRLLPAFYAFTILAIIVNLIMRPDFILGIEILTLSEKIKWGVANFSILGYATTQNQLLVPAWSLDIEMQFYILFPLIIFVTKGHKKPLLILTSVFFALALYLWGYLQTYFYVFSYLFLFMFGMLVYKNKIAINKKAEKVSVILLALIVLSQYMVPRLALYYKDVHSIYYNALSFVLIIFATPTLINSVHNKSEKGDRFWGEMSFMVYLAHWVWIEPYHIILARDPLNILSSHFGKFARVPYGLLFLMITFLSSYLIYKLIDRPSESLRHKWVNKQA